MRSHFEAQNEVLLYNVTSTYVEGQANPEAQRGYSRGHRPDCKQVCIAPVVEGHFHCTGATVHICS